MFCKICGTENVPQAAFCENCGAKLSEGAPSQNNMTATPVTAPDNDMSEPVVEEMYEYEEKPKKKKSTVVLIVLIIVLAVLVCGAVGVLLSRMLSPEGVGFSDNSTSSGEQQQQEDDGEEEEEDEEKKKEQIECENLVKDVMGAVENENTDVVEEHLGFECGDSDDLSEKMAKAMGEEFDCDHKALKKVSAKMLTEYFHSMESHIKETEESGGEYIITVSFTRLDKEAVLGEILKFDADKCRDELREKYESSDEESEKALTDEEIEEKVEAELLDKIIEMAEDKIADAELITDELEFVVAEDDGEWFIYTDASAFSDLEKELTIEE